MNTQRVRLCAVLRRVNREPPATGGATSESTQHFCARAGRSVGSVVCVLILSPWTRRGFSSGHLRFASVSRSSSARVIASKLTATMRNIAAAEEQAERQSYHHHSPSPSPALTRASSSSNNSNNDGNNSNSSSRKNMRMPNPDFKSRATDATQGRAPTRCVASVLAKS